MRVYAAGPLFTAAERAWNKWFAGELRARGHDVILPQVEAARFITRGSIDFAGIFSMCIQQIREADAVVAIFDGADVDSGTAFECGYGYAIGKPILGVRTDLRSGGEENGVNAMLSRCCQQLVYVPAFNPGEEIVDSIVAALSTVKAASVR